jgi:hypothetical protein
MEPGVPALRVAQPGQVPPGSQQRILDSVSRELVVPEDEARRGIQPRDGSAGKSREGVMIARSCLLDETSLVHGRPRCGATMVAALRWYGVAIARIVPLVPRSRSDRDHRAG